MGIANYFWRHEHKFMYAGGVIYVGLYVAMVYYSWDIVDTHSPFTFEGLAFWVSRTWAALILPFVAIEMLSVAVIYAFILFAFGGAIIYHVGRFLILPFILLYEWLSERRRHNERQR